jgi:hypothetical protein
MMHKALANGACEQNCTAVHAYEDEAEKVKMRINHHIADNWENDYQYKVGLP